MTKLSRKLLLSVLTVAFALITLGATTFAWFTLSNKAEVQEFQVDVTAGAGIEISLDGTVFSSSIRASDVLSVINSGSTSILDDVTTYDGYNFKTINEAREIVETTTGYAFFDLFFRSPEPNVKVYLLNNSYIKSQGILWKPDVTFYLREGKQVSPESQSERLYAANALRFSTREYVVTEQESNPPLYSHGDYANIFEIDPADVTNNQRFDNVIQTAYGSVDYYNSKYYTPDDQTPLFPLVAAEQPKYTHEVLNQNAFKDPQTLMQNQSKHYIASLDARYDSPTTYYYSRIRVYIWLEGWDPDMFNAIMADQIRIYLNFGGSAVVPELNVTSETTLELAPEATSEIAWNTYKAGTEKPTIDYNPTFESANKEVVTVDANGLITAVGAGSTTVTVSIPGYSTEPVEITVYDTEK